MDYVILKVHFLFAQFFRPFDSIPSFEYLNDLLKTKTGCLGVAQNAKYPPEHTKSGIEAKCTYEGIMSLGYPGIEVVVHYLQQLYYLLMISMLHL